MQPTNLLKNRTLVTIGLAEAISHIGDWITMMAIFALLVFKGGGGVAESSGVYLAGLLPALPASALAGWLCDRFDRKKLMVASQLLSALSVVGLIFTDRLELIYLLLALEAVFISVMGPARQSVIPDIVDKEDLPRANALLQQFSGIIKIGAPVLAGAILAVMSPHQAIILDVISFILAGVMLSFIPSLPAVKRAASENQVSENFEKKKNVWGVILSSSGLQLIFVSMFLGIFVIIGFDVLATVYTRDVAQANEQYFGISIGLVGFGTLLSTFWLMLRKQNRNPWSDLMMGIGMLAVIPLALALGSYLNNPALCRAVVLVGCFIGGIGNGLVNVQIITLLQTLAPDGMLGRVSGLFQSTVTAGQLMGIILTPILVPGVVSMGTFFLISTLCLIVLVVYMVVKLNSDKHMFLGLPGARRYESGIEVE